ncbi:MAG TPA: hypothetical protein V6C72_14175 [Chroococcales cyanobacterium]
MNEFLAGSPVRGADGDLIYQASDGRNQLTLSFSDNGKTAALSVGQCGVEYSNVKMIGIELFQFSPEHDTLLIEGEDSQSKSSQARFQTQVTVRPRIEVHNHVKILSDTAIIEGINWHVLESLMGSLGEIAPSGTITFQSEAGSRGTLELEIGEEGWSATAAFTVDGERLFNTTIEEVQFFNVSKDNQSLVLLAKAGNSSCLTRVTLRPEPSFDTTVHLF